MAVRLAKHQRDSGALAPRPKHVGLLGGRVRWRRHRQTTAKRSEAFFQNRQVVAKNYAESTRDPRCRLLLCWRRSTQAASSPPARAVGALPEESEWVLGEEKNDVPSLLLRVRPGFAGDSRTGLGFAHNTKPFAFYI